MKTSGRSVIEGVGRATLLAWLAAGSLGVSALEKSKWSTWILEGAHDN